VLLDLKLPGGDALELLFQCKSHGQTIAWIVMTANATVESAVNAIRIGASDYLIKPFPLKEMTTALIQAAQTTNRNVEYMKVRERLHAQLANGDLIGISASMDKVRRIISKVSLSSHHLLISGESGTGKEVVAHLIHKIGLNANKPFVVVDCGALTATLIESELFGHVKGAFTGATVAKQGLLSVAKGGTVFLDEIGELPLELQARLLRALQEREVRPVGATTSVPFSGRILAATNRDLQAMVERGEFRKDLYYRLNIVNLKLPPLRERREDIPLLAQYFLEQVQANSGTKRRFSNAVAPLLEVYDWPGNVRELQHAVESACAMSEGYELQEQDLPQDIQKRLGDLREKSRTDGRQSDDHGDDDSQPPVVPLAIMEKAAILKAVKDFDGDKLRAAKLLGIGKTTLYRKLQQYDANMRYTDESKRVARDPEVAPDPQGISLSAG
jgi:two-component system response regulator HydG